MVKECASAEEFNSTIASGKVCVDFHAVWCGPCLQIAPHLAQLDTDNEHVTFIKVNVDCAWAKGLMQTHGVKCMPTFLFFHDGKVMNKLEGASKDGLNSAVASL